MRAPPLIDGIRHRIERCATAFHIRRLELLRDLPGNPCGIEVRRFGDHVVATAASGVPDVDWLQHVAGLEPGDEMVVPEIAAWYRQRGIRPRFEIAPATEFDALASALADVRARQTGFIDALWKRVEALPDRVATDVDIRVVDPDSDDAALFARVLLGGHGVPDDASTEHFDTVALWASEPGWSCYLASDGSQPLGAAALAVDDGIGYLASASTLPTGRRRGCQQALIRRRLHDASVAGCELTASLATPGTSSHRNLERAGLAVACTLVFWAVVD